MSDSDSEPPWDSDDLPSTHDPGVVIDPRSEIIDLLNGVADRKPGDTVYDTDLRLRSAEVLAMVYVGDQIGVLAKALLAGEKTVVRPDP